MTKTAYLAIMVCGLVGSFLVGNSLSQPRATYSDAATKIVHEPDGTSSEVSGVVQPSERLIDGAIGNLRPPYTTEDLVPSNTTVKKIDEINRRLNKLLAPYPSSAPQDTPVRQFLGCMPVRSSGASEKELDSLKVRLLELTRQRLKTMTVEEVNAEITRVDKEIKENYAARQLLKAHGILREIVKFYPKSHAANQAGAMLTVRPQSGGPATDEPVIQRESRLQDNRQVFPGRVLESIVPKPRRPVEDSRSVGAGEEPSFEPATPE